MSKHFPNQNCVYINCDGACRPNPGFGAIGIVIRGEDNKTILKKHKEYIGETTNSQAEYRAVIKALKLAKNFTHKSVNIFTDSEFLVKQMNGEYRVKDEKIKVLYKEVIKLKKLYQDVKYNHVKRGKSDEADRLANAILDEVLMND